MKKMCFKKNILLLCLIGFISSCGPSHEDEVAANRGCELAEQHEIAYVAKGGSEAIKKRAISQYTSRVIGYFSGLKYANVDTVKKLIKKQCPTKAKYVDEAIKQYADRMGIPESGLPKGYETLFLGKK